MSEEKPKREIQMPVPPEGVTDPDQIEGAEERWHECPLRDCKRNSALLYEDFYLRDVRTNRLMCSACVVRTEVGYLAREVVKASDDRFFSGSVRDDLIVMVLMFAGSLIAHIISLFIGFFYIAFFIGIGAGGAMAPLARRITGRRVTRQTQYFAIGGILLGMILAPSLWFLLRVGLFYFSLDALINFSLLACTAGMVSAAWGIFLRRI